MKMIVETKQRIEKPGITAGFVEMHRLPCFADTTDEHRRLFIGLVGTLHRYISSRIFEESRPGFEGLQVDLSETIVMIVAPI